MPDPVPVYSGFDPGIVDVQAAAAADPNFLSKQAEQGRGIVNTASNALNSLWDFIKFPGDVYGGKYSLNDISRLAPGYAAQLATLGAPIGVASTPESSLGLFGGVKSFAAPRVNLSMAKTLESVGESRDTINSITGWFRGPDGLWRNTISDESAELNPKAFQYGPGQTLELSAPTSLKDALIHPRLFYNYPKLGSYKVEPTSPFETTLGVRAAFEPDERTFRLGPGTEENILSSLLHETQHGIQDTIEGFAPGGSERQFIPQGYYDKLRNYNTQIAAFSKMVEEQHPNLSPETLDNLAFMLHGGIDPKSAIGSRLISKLSPFLQRQAGDLFRTAEDFSRISDKAYSGYQRLAGEVEARAVQEQLERQDWTTPIWQHEGYIPFEQQIVLPPWKPGQPMQLIPIDHDPFAEASQ